MGIFLLLYIFIIIFAKKENRRFVPLFIEWFQIRLFFSFDLFYFPLHIAISFCFILISFSFCRLFLSLICFQNSFAYAPPSPPSYLYVRPHFGPLFCKKWNPQGTPCGLHFLHRFNRERPPLKCSQNLKIFEILVPPETSDRAISDLSDLSQRPQSGPPWTSSGGPRAGLGRRPALRSAAHSLRSSSYSLKMALRAIGVTLLWSGAKLRYAPEQMESPTGLFMCYLGACSAGGGPSLSLGRSLVGGETPP